MDVSHGLLDTLCNPRPAFHALRCLNTILYGSGALDAREPGELACDGVRGLQFVAGGRKWVLLLPMDFDDGRAPWARALADLIEKEKHGHLYLLNQGAVMKDVGESGLARLEAELDGPEPSLLSLEFAGEY